MSEITVVVPRPMNAHVKLYAEVILMGDSGGGGARGPFYFDIEDSIPDDVVQDIYASLGGRVYEALELAMSEEKAEAARLRQTPPRRNPPSHVYLIQSGQYHKIGISSQPPERFKALQKTVPYPIEVHGVWPMPRDEARATESDWHSYFSEKRHAGEWFDLTPDDVALIRQRMAGGAW